MRKALLIALLCCPCAAVAGAQGAPRDTTGGARLSATCATRGLTLQQQGDLTLPSLGIRDGVDTVVRINVAERRWQQPRLASLLGVSAQNAAQSVSVCASIGIEMQDPSLTVRGASGLVHLRLSLDDLSRALATRDSMRR